MAVVTKKIRPYLFLMQVSCLESSPRVLCISDLFPTVRSLIDVDGTIALDCSGEITLGEAEQNLGKYRILDRAHVGIPTVVSGP